MFITVRFTGRNISFCCFTFFFDLLFFVWYQKEKVKNITQVYLSLTEIETVKYFIVFDINHEAQVIALWKQKILQSMANPSSFMWPIKSKESNNGNQKN